MQYWCVMLKVQYENYPVIHICAIYRSPSRLSSKIEFCQDLENWIDYLAQCGNFIIMGDVNMDWFDVTDTYTRRVSNILNDNGLNMIINEPTRITSHSKTLIDYVITNCSDTVSARVDSNLKISDHESIDIIIKNQHKKLNKKTIRYCSYSENLFLARLSEDPFFAGMNTEQPLSLNALCDKFVFSLKNIVDSMVKEKQVPYDNAEWFNNELSVEKIRKINLYRQAVISNDNNAWHEYQQCRNQFKRKIRLAKSRFVKNQIENASNQKDMWKKLKKYVLKKNDETILEVEVEDGSVINESAIMCDKFNNFFVQSINEITQSVIYSDYTN